MNNFYRYPNYNSSKSYCNRNSQPDIFPKSAKPPPPPKKKLDFKCLKKDTCKSLNDVEHFLCDFSSFVKYFKLYCLLKK